MDFSKIIIKQDLPISQYEEEIISRFNSSNNMIIIGETGSGKTTQIPLMLLKSLSKVQDMREGKIAVTEPRRLAATSVCNYLSSYIGATVGGPIGYKIRFSQEVTDESVLIFMTDGIMLREAQIDPLLLDYSVVMVDEAHERNINSDFLIGLLIDIQQKRKELDKLPLKIIVTSATLEKDKFVNFFNKIEEESLAQIEVPGRLFPITTEFAKKDIYNYEDEAAKKVLEICKQNNRGDILIFMPGKREIEDTKKAIEALPNFPGLHLEIITVHADLPIEKQNEIFKQTENRKVVIATNIAETSLTVPGIVYVIDSGLIKQMEFNPHTGIKSLVTTMHATKGLDQRKGRAGRIEPGVYYPLFTQSSLLKRQEFQTPEILRSPLSQIVLIMKKIGIKDIDNFHFIDQPEIKSLDNALVELQRYNAIDRDGNITEKGETMASLPLDPRLANFILEADKNNCLESICIICAYLEIKPIIKTYTFDDFYKELEEQSIKSNIPLDTEHYLQLEIEAKNRLQQYKNKINTLEDNHSDFFTTLNIYSKWIYHEKRPEWCQENFLSSDVIDEGNNIKEEIEDIVKKAGYDPKDRMSNDLYKRIERTIYSAFKYNTLVRQDNNLYKNIRSNDKNIKIHSSSVLYESKPKYIVAYEIVEISDIDSIPKLSARVLHSLEEEKIKQFLPDFYKKEQKRRRVFKKKGQYSSRRNKRHKNFH